MRYSVSKMGILYDLILFSVRSNQVLRPPIYLPPPYKLLRRRSPSFYYFLIKFSWSTSFLRHDTMILGKVHWKIVDAIASYDVRLLWKNRTYECIFLHPSHYPYTSHSTEDEAMWLSCHWNWENVVLQYKRRDFNNR